MKTKNSKIGEVLRQANLYGADLHHKQLLYADLSESNLCHANLRGANLSYANLRYAILNDADLRYANLRGADLSYAHFTDARLEGADLESAILTGADLYVPDITPEGAFTAWIPGEGAVIKIYVPEDAVRMNGTNGIVIRVSKAECVRIEKPDDSRELIGLRSMTSRFNEDMFTIGEVKYVKDFKMDRFAHDNNDIYCYLSRAEAVRRIFHIK